MNKNIIAILALAFLLSACLPVQPAPIQQLASDVIWRGDAETGDLSQWQNVNQGAPGRITVVDNPVAQGNYAYKFVLNNGDTIFGTERVTLSQQYDTSKYEINGQEKYYGWSVMLPTDYPFPSSWSLVVQWKGIHTGSPPIQLSQKGGDWQLTYRPTVNSSNIVKWRTPVKKGQYENFVMHVKWSTDASIGFIELWYNGVLVVPLFHTANIHTNGTSPVPNYIAMGLYRDASISTNVVLYHDGMVVGRTYESVTGELPLITVTPSTSTPVVTRTITPTRTATRTPTITQTITVTPITTPTYECLLFPVHNQRVCLP